MSVSSPRQAVLQGEPLVLTEIMYHPKDYGETLGQDLEYLELLNGENNALDLSRAALTEGVLFTFPEGTWLEAGERIVLVSSEAAFSARYPEVPVLGEFEGQLANSGERIVLQDAEGEVLLEVEFDDDFPWPVEADGFGYSLSLKDESLWPEKASDGRYWTASRFEGGSPGEAEAEVDVSKIWVNELLAHTDLPLLDSVELFNGNAFEVDLSNWWVSDDLTEPSKYAIPSGTILAAGGFLVLSEVELGFRFDSHGDSIWLTAVGEDSQPSGYRHGFSFGASQNGVSFGRLITSDGVECFAPMQERSLGAANSDPRTGSVIISEILYDPLQGETEYIEIVNTTAEIVSLFDVEYPENCWKIEGVDFVFPSGSVLEPGEVALIVSSDPDSAREALALSESVQVFGPYSGALNNGGERISLLYPDKPDEMDDGSVYVPYLEADSVFFELNDEWESPPDGWSLERKGVQCFAQDAKSWRVVSFKGGSPGWLRMRSYPDWADEVFSPDQVLNLDVVAEGADPDADGRSNLWEYALGTDPLTADLQRTSVWTPTEQGVHFQVSMGKDLADLALSMQSSSDLETWFEVGEEFAGESAFGDVQFTKSYDVPLGNEAEPTFYRVRLYSNSGD